MSTSQRDAFVACAKAQIGRPYRWASANPEDGFDCSGLVAFCYEQATGEAISRGSYEQYRLGRAIDATSSQPGDLHFWDTFGPAPGHVAIDIGDGLVAHALNEQSGVKTSRRDANMGGPFMGTRRLFTEGTPSSEPTGKPGGDAGRPDGEGGSTPPLSTTTRNERTKRERDRQRRRRRKA